MKKVTRSLLVAGSTLALLAGSFAPSLAVPFALADTPSDTAAAYSNGTDTGAFKLPALISKVSTVTDDTIRGIDLTPYQAELAAGVKYKDFNGRSLDEEGFMNLLKDSGANYVNLKVAVVCVKFFSTRFKYRVFQDTLFVHFRLPCFTCSV